MYKVKAFLRSGDTDQSGHSNIDEASCEAFDLVWNGEGGIAYIDGPGVCYRLQLEVMPIGSSGVRGRVAPRNADGSSGGSLH